MGSTVTYLVELLVGLACLLLAASVGRIGRPAHRFVAFVLALLGAAAAVHALVRLIA